MTPDSNSPACSGQPTVDECRRRPFRFLLFGGVVSALIGIAGCSTPAGRSIEPDPAVQELPAIAASPELTNALALHGGTHIVAGYTVGSVAGAVAISKDTCYSATMDSTSGPAVATIPIPRTTGDREDTDSAGIRISRSIGYYGTLELELDNTITVVTYCGPRGAAITITGDTITTPPTLAGAAELAGDTILITPPHLHAHVLTIRLDGAALVRTHATAGEVCPCRLARSSRAG